MGRHLKRLASPTTWHVPRKTNVWITTTNPGPHPKDRALPLAIIVRDVLKLCDFRREAKSIISGRGVAVDGRIVTDIRFPVGLMDRLALAKSDQYFQMLINKQGKILPVPIEKGDAKWKLVRIEGKRKIKGGKFQINTHDGRCFVMDECKYRPGDVLKIELLKQKVLGYLPFAKGNIAYIIGGSHVGETGHIDSVEVVKGSMPNQVRFKEGFATRVENAFVIGTTKALVSVDFPEPMKEVEETPAEEDEDKEAKA